jgi:hypothetical protein
MNEIMLEQLRMYIPSYLCLVILRTYISYVFVCLLIFKLTRSLLILARDHMQIWRSFCPFFKNKKSLVLMQLRHFLNWSFRKKKHDRQIPYLDVHIIINRDLVNLNIRRHTKTYDIYVRRITRHKYNGIYIRSLFTDT